MVASRRSSADANTTAIPGRSRGCKGCASGAVDFVRDAAGLIPEPGSRSAGFFDWPGSGLAYLDGILERVLRHPTLAEARQLGALEVRDSFGGHSPTRALARPPGRWQQLVNPACLRTAYEHAFWKKGFLAQLSPRQAAKLPAR